MPGLITAMTNNNRQQWFLDENGVPTKMADVAKNQRINSLVEGYIQKLSDKTNTTGLGV